MRFKVYKHLFSVLAMLMAMLMMSLGTELQPVQLLNCMIIAETLPVPLQNILGSSAIV